jgi:hypothetical protein
LRFWVGQFAARFEAFGGDLVRRLAVEDALTATIVGGVEAAQQLLELRM